MKKLNNYTNLRVLMVCYVLSIISTQIHASAAANLDQARNGTDASPVTPINWVNGNAGGSQAHYIEGMSIPYRCVMTGITAGTQITIIIGYDVRNSGRNAIDYLTQYNRLLTHSFLLHSVAESINPLAGTLLSSPPSTTYAIPVPASNNNVPKQPVTNYSALSSSERLMTLYNGTIDTIYYVSQGDLAASTSTTQIAVKFTPSATTAVLVWGGHIASRNDWGYDGSGNPNSAGGISGSPFHMTIVSWTAGSAGSQDRSLSGGAVFAPPIPMPIELLSFKAQSKKDYTLLTWTTATEINSDHFILEKSTDGIEFHTEAILPAAGNSSTAINYNYTDRTPLEMITYYRLVEVDFDGTRNEYGIISVNPRSSRTYQQHIYNLQGTLMKTIEEPTDEFAFSELPAGFYLYQYYIGSNAVVKKIFVVGNSLSDSRQ